MNSNLFFFFILFSALPGIAARFEIKGQASIAVGKMSESSTAEVSRVFAPVGLQFESSYLLTRSLSLQFQPWMQTDPLSKSSEDKFQFEIQELSLQHKQKSRRIKAGLTTVNWEGTDLVNPMDLMNAKNWSDPLAPVNRGSGSLVYSDENKSFAWDLIYTPNRSKDVFPSDENPWWPRSLNLPTENEKIVLQIPSELKYRTLQEQVLDSALTNNYGLRLQYHGPQWDLSLAGVDGASSPAMLVPTLDVTPVQLSPLEIYRLQTPVRMTPVYYRQRSAALAFVKVWDDLILRLSAQHQQPIGNDRRTPSWSQLTVIELEKTLSWDEQSLTLIMEYTQSKRPDTTSFASISSLLQQAYILGIRWPFAETWLWNAAIFQEQKYKSNYFHSELTKSWGDHVSTSATVDLFAGSDQSLIGVFDANDRLMAKMIYAF